jgi:cell wall-associated NlpC family hydrolase
VPSFIYAPQLKIYVETGGNLLNKNVKPQVLDVSDDVVRGRLTRRVDGVSDLQFTLTNNRRKYDQVFTPNDRVTVLMKRVTWLRVFTGYLNSVPLMTGWPRDVDLTASCSLKRLQYWYWDPESAYTQQMIMNALSAARGSGMNSDGGMTNVVLSVLKEVVGWPESKVHIAKIPDDWFKTAYKIAEAVDKSAQESDDLAQQFFQSLGGAGTVGSPGGGVDTSALNGRYGGYDSAEQKANAVKIYNAGRSMGATRSDQIVAIMTAMQESGLVNLNHGDRDSVGLFQQRPSQGWGTVQQCMDPTYAAKKFFSALFNIKNRDKMTKGQQAQAVQRSAYPSAYDKHEPAATNMVDDMIKGGGTNPVVGSGSSNSTEKSPSARATGTATNYQFIQVAKDLVTTYPNIPYTQKYGGTQMAILSANPPPGLDCSSFIQAVVLRTLGGLYNFPRTTTTQLPVCRKIDVQTALKTPGALLFKGSPPHHVEMSVGDGKHAVGAHHTGTFASVQQTSASYWTTGALVPRIDYGKLGMGDGNAGDGSVTDTPGAGAAEKQIYTDPYSSTPGYNANDPFDKLFGDTTWQPVASQKNDPGYILSQSLTGIKSLMNDQPLLPYLKNLFSATMRSFCSAPNGDLMAWFPDYYGLWGTAAKMVVQPIEVKDFSVTWDDSFFVTHQFVATTPQGGAGQNGLNLATGEVTSLVGAALDPLVVAQNLSYTRGIASIDIPAMMYALFKINPSTAQAETFSKWIYQRFGARPDFQQLPNLVGPSAQFFASIYYFMRQWAYQYNADIPLTFMPELYPGMLLQVPAFSFQGYVNSVQHTWEFGDNGSFETSVNISAPARLSDTGNAADVLIGLPRAGGLIAS